MQQASHWHLPSLQPHKQSALAKPAATQQSAAKAAKLPRSKATAEGHVPFATKKMKLQAVKPLIKPTQDAEAVLDDWLGRLSKCHSNLSS